MGSLLGVNLAMLDMSGYPLAKSLGINCDTSMSPCLTAGPLALGFEYHQERWGLCIYLFFPHRSYIQVWNRYTLCSH